jgi:hypothetical protein
MGEVCTRPVCTQHGPMKFDAVLGWWLCWGWAGEGCLTGMMVTDDQARRMEPLPGVAYFRSAA